MPRLKSAAERGYIGVWMREERVKRGWSPEQVVDALSALEHPIRVDYYRGLEAGRRPGPELLQALTKLYGTEPIEPAPEPTGTTEFGAVLKSLELQTDLLAKQWAATVALTDSIGSLVAELRRDHRETDERAVTFAELLARLEVAGLPASTPAEDESRRQDAR
jgi:transcriptional regulator with XRE-family HTH domain